MMVSLPRSKSPCITCTCPCAGCCAAMGLGVPRSVAADMSDVGLVTPKSISLGVPEAGPASSTSMPPNMSEAGPVSSLLPSSDSTAAGLAASRLTSSDSSALGLVAPRSVPADASGLCCCSSVETAVVRAIGRPRLLSVGRFPGATAPGCRRWRATRSSCSMDGNVSCINCSSAWSRRVPLCL